LYLPFRQEPRGTIVVLAATAGDSLSTVRPLREIIRTLDPELPIAEAQTIEAFYAARATGFLKIATEMVGGIGLMGTALTMVGLYGLVSFSVARRTREIGIRMAIGATYAHVLKMILRQGMRPAWFGLGAGLILSVAATRLLPSLFPTADRYEPRTFLIVVPALLAVTLLAAFVPARRAARVDPTVALRHD
jgi:ABC-type antimicrobial peptide transport system permease subunit